MADPEAALQGIKDKFSGRKSTSSVSGPSTTNFSDRIHLELHQVARDGNLEKLDELLQNTYIDLDGLDAKQNSALHYAARYSHVEIVQKLLATSKADVDVLGSEKMTPLHYASRYGKNITERSTHGRTEAEDDKGVKVVDILLQNGADLNGKDVYKLSPLHHAAMRGNFKVVEFLTLQKGVQLNIRDVQKSTPLHLSATYGNLKVTKNLLEAKADCKARDIQQQNALHRAAKEGKNQIVEHILDHLNEVDKKDVMKQMDAENNSPLLLAVQAGNSDAVKIFMEKGGSAEYVDQPNDKGECPLHSATRSGNITTVKTLVEHGARINTLNRVNETPLFLAAENAKDIDIVKFLVEKGAKLNQQNKAGISPIMIAACRGHVDVVKYLSDKGANLDIEDHEDQTIIHLAARNGQTPVIEALLKDNKKDPRVNENDQYDNTPLHHACQKGFLETVDKLLYYGGEINNNNEDELTPFHLAAKYGHVEVVRHLLEKDPNAIFNKDEEDNTALHLAVTAKMTYTVDVLLKEGASVHEKNKSNWTPLDCAAASGAYKCAELLISNRSPLDPLDTKKITPLHLTAIHGHQRVAQLLLNHGANIELENDEGKNALELAIHHRNRNVAETILESKHWEDALKTSNVIITRKGEKVLDTPMRMLIRVFPDIAQKVFDKCITTENTKEKENDTANNGNHALNLDYQFLDDTFSFEKLEEKKMYFKYVEKGKRKMKEPYDSNQSTVMENHPLMLMVKHKHKHLLKHPLCIGLLRHKWKRFGRYVFYFQFFLYSLFLASITSNVLLKMEGKEVSGNESEYLSFSAGPLEKLGSNKAEIVTAFCVLFLGGIGLIIEVLEIVRMKWDYIKFSNIVDWGIYGLAGTFVFNINIPFHTEGCTDDKCWQWLAGSFLLTCSWLNLLVYFRQLPFFGIFIIMFMDILKTISKFAVVLAVFIIAFGLGFHIVFLNQATFKETEWSLIKTYVMMIGEFEFQGIFTESEDARDDPFPFYSAIMFIMFVIIMSIIMMNLLVGLAVGDIKKIQDNAELEKLSMHVKLVLELERFFPYLQWRLSDTYLEDYNSQEDEIKAQRGIFIQMKDVLSKVTIWSNFENRGEGDGNDNTMDKIAENLRELGKVVRDQTTQLDILMEETSELRDMIAKIEKKTATL